MQSFIVKDGYGIIAACLAAAVILTSFGEPSWGTPFFALSLFMLFFFRNPARALPKDDKAVFSPADGTVMDIADFIDHEYLDAEAKKITVFLSVFDVHVNRSPVRGEIKYQSYTCGRFRPAYKSIASFENERHAIGIENEKIKILVIQIAGILARRIVSWVTLGHDLKQGQRYGMIKFGSSTELIVPQNVRILVKKGDKVKGGVTVMGRIEE
ncbi:MAG: phosphatidylserine decarboxylase family protein [Acidaminococcales bacterium]|jgi:phosphatidylserine decarboxylase|nr:phosphatidylserine decarboxylase family protein [Acidaminococcales bacterium]